MPFRGHDTVGEWAVACARAKRYKRTERMLKAVRGETINGFYRRCLHRGDLAFDIGANLGDHTAAMLRCGTRVVALEPQREMADRLAREFPKATVLPLAAGAKTGTATLATSSRYHAWATLSAEWTETEPEGTWDGSGEVPVTSVDELIAVHGVPAMLKVDTEGFEDAVFSAVSAPIRHVLVEVHRDAPKVAQRVFGRLAELGRYDLRIMSRESWEFRPATAEGILADLPVWGDVHAKRSRS